MSSGGDGGVPYSDLDRPPLDAAALRRSLGAGRPGSWWTAADVVAESGSTNADLAERARAGAAATPAGATLLVAEHQTEGRGRRGRSWQAPARSALTLSVLLRPVVPAERWSWLPLLVGVAVAEAVERTTGVEARLKWPNDVVVDDRKLAGILLERVESRTGPAAVIGVGLNVSLRRDELPVPTASSLLLETGETVDRQPLLLALLRTLEALYLAWSETAGDPGAGLHASYVRRSATLGRSVRVALPEGGSLSGTAESVDAAGRLVVATGTGRRTIGAGDVVHVRPVV
ncbi:MAG TPA: biotin--[acetyl-CoA-carboxylase] ligase [Nocardioidaceae bacterium]|nr:biotin--[acetyl-CoA-carboxylase] ligase [Nocardioidaceae bacterium]